jgi:hypothetical protein
MRLTRSKSTAIDIHAQIEQEWRQTVGAQQYRHLRHTLAQLMGPEHSRSSSA